MATDYSKKKNAELEELLKARSLPHTGKKAELVARLQQYDAEQASAVKQSASASATIGDEDQIDWEEEDAPAATAAPATGSTPATTAAIAAGGQGQVANPTAVPNQALDTDPSKTDDLSIKPPASTGKKTDPNKTSPTVTTTTTAAAAAAPPTDFTSGLQASTIDDEIAKRQKRAARFGIQESNEDAMKALARAKKFGTGSGGDKTAVRGLDEALPERAKKERGVKRGRDEAKDARPAAKRRESGRREDIRQTRSGSRPQAKAKGMEMSEKDRLAAEARKKWFGTAALGVRLCGEVFFFFFLFLFEACTTHSLLGNEEGFFFFGTGEGVPTENRFGEKGYSQLKDCYGTV